MPTTIPSLWPSDIMVDVRPPLEILRGQAEKIAEITQGILTAEVTTVTGHEDFAVHRLDLVAAKLDGRAYRILTGTHRAAFYPVVIEADLYRLSYKEAIARTIAGNSLAAALTSVTGGSSWPPTDDWRPVANDQDEFLKRIAEVLRSPTVRSIIDSLLALCNEKNQPADTESAA